MNMNDKIIEYFSIFKQHLTKENIIWEVFLRVFAMSPV